MVLKFLTAGLIAALLAAGAVYYSLDAQNLQPRGVPSAVPSATMERDTPPGTEHYRLNGTDSPSSDADERPAAGTDTLATDTPATDRDERPSPDAPKPRKATDFDILVAQAGALELVDMRDDAYLTLLDWALQDERYRDAMNVAGRLSAPELRDTARQRIGISHARAGRMQEAFAILEQVEIEPLTDPIRLEIIRAATRDE
ncbi:hypothetical protein ACFFUB_13250 [Algimonas porphyrae]|uniref:Tetratricopeptide repeat protein n=1 Tax=Algimonas porphyrae TaxID=1128113 RepID=A0ABQ5UVS7_9PROT|nr:hypothetical protein [Algimonas porphyrae]GLQ19384.1 hypothetical protein GCM10007854_03390 [Algimonas porphyrae]